MRKILLAGAALAALAFLPHEVSAQAKPQPGQAVKMALVPKFLGILPFDLAHRGAEEAATELKNPVPLLYLGPYLDAIGDEYQPFGVGLDKLDEIAAGELLARDGASDAAIRFNGLRRGDGSQAARNGEVQRPSGSQRAARGVIEVSPAGEVRK